MIQYGNLNVTGVVSSPKIIVGTTVNVSGSGLAPSVGSYEFPGIIGAVGTALVVQPNNTLGFTTVSTSGSGSGVSGFSGFSGLNGIASASGYSGFSGKSGYSGFSGTNGVSGFSGFSGTGISGFSGFSGAGLSGFSGFSGKSGFSGFSGISGFSGSIGLSGFSGFSGTNGVSGFSGFSGTGISGFSGFSGAGLSGFSGFSGKSGFSGFSGTNGTTGVSGFSGFSGNGLSGFSGFSGAGEALIGTQWTSRTSVADNNWQSICFGNGLFVAVSNTGSGNRVSTSPDGVNWTIRSSAANLSWASVCFGKGKFIAVAFSGSNPVMSSSDGITWSTVTTGFAGASAVCFGNGLFVAVSDSAVISTSSDGNTWTTATTLSGYELTSVCYGNGLYVAGGLDNLGNVTIVTSPTGSSWTTQTVDHSDGNEITAVCYGNGVYVAVATGEGDATKTAWSSTDGATWTLRTSISQHWVAVCYGHGTFVAVGQIGVMISTDGITWTDETLPAIEIQWNGICYGNGIFVACAQTGTGNRIMTSGFTDVTEPENFYFNGGGAGGTSGYSGFSGKSGFSGFSGGAGLSGFSGFSGVSGFSGFSGVSGYSGYSGFSGVSGYSGFSGKSGFSGFSGFSGVSGFSGFSGFSGVSGYSGVVSTFTSGPGFTISYGSIDNILDTEADNFWPRSAYYCPWSDRANLQARLNTYKRVRLDYADYTTGSQPALILTSGMCLYGLGGTTFPAMTIAAGSSGVIINGGNCNAITFQPGALISNCQIRRIYFCSTQGTGTQVDSCVFIDCGYGNIAFDNSSTGYTNNCRFIGGHSQGSATDYSFKGNPSNKNVGNMIISHSFAQCSVAGLYADNFVEMSIMGSDIEQFAASALITFGPGSGSAKVVTFAGGVGGSGGSSTIFDTYAAKTTFYNIYISRTLDTTYESTALLSADFNNILTTPDVDHATSPSRFSFNSNNSTTIKKNGSTASAPLTGGQITDFASLFYPPRTDYSWPTPAWSYAPADPLGATWNVGLASKPDSSAYIQSLMNANGIAVLPEGIFYISNSLVIENGHGIVGAGRDKTIIVATSTSVDMIIQGASNPVQQIVLADLTLQGGANGIHHSAADGTPLQWQWTNMMLSHVCFRNFAHAGIWVDKAYAWDTNFIDNLDFVNCVTGIKQTTSTNTNNISYFDKNVFLRCRFLGCGTGISLVVGTLSTGGGRPNNLDSFIDCLFADNTSVAFEGNLCNEFMFINSTFQNNAGSPSIYIWGSDATFVGCNWTADVLGSQMVDVGTLSMFDCTFNRGTSSSALIFGNAFATGTKLLNNCTSVDMPTGTSRTNNLVSINTLYGAGDQTNLNNLFSVNVSSSNTKYITGAPLPVKQMLQQSQLPLSITRLLNPIGPDVSEVIQPSLPGILNITSNYTILNTDLNAGQLTVMTDTTSGNVTVTLPSYVPSGSIVRAKKIASTNTMIISGGPVNIDDTTSVSVTDKNVTIPVQFDGIKWRNILFTMPVGTIVGTSDAQTLSNKRTTRRVSAVTNVSNTFTPAGDTTDVAKLSVTAGFTIANATGTPTDGQLLEIIIANDVTGGYSISYGTAYAGTTDIVLPTTSSTSSKVDRLIFEWSAAASKWVLITKNFGGS